jgi:hypothetical protein
MGEEARDEAYNMTRTRILTCPLHMVVRQSMRSQTREVALLTGFTK